jgi:hypothetical protein
MKTLYSQAVESSYPGIGCTAFVLLDDVGLSSPSGVCIPNLSQPSDVFSESHADITLRHHLGDANYRDRVFQKKMQDFYEKINCPLSSDVGARLL